MKSIEVQLLEFLGNGVRPFNAGQVSADNSAFDFDRILSSARNGDARTDLGIRFAPSASGMFDTSDQFVIARGVDKAAAAGVDHALILHNQQTLRIDVRNRLVLDVYPLKDQSVIDGIDGFISVDTRKNNIESIDHDSSQGGVSTPARVVRNASLVHALAGRVPD